MIRSSRFRQTPKWPAAGTLMLASALLMPSTVAEQRDSAPSPTRQIVPTEGKTYQPPLQTSQMPVQWQLDQLRAQLQNLQQQVQSLQNQGPQGADPQALANVSARLGLLESALVVTPGKVTLQSPAAMELRAAGTITANVAQVEVSGLLRSSQVITDSVVASSYTPGAGNVW